MGTIFILIGIGVFLLGLEIIHQPRIDRNTETGELVLWYYGNNHERKFITLFKIIQ
jgi:hypothetical protein